MNYIKNNIMALERVNEFELWPGHFVDGGLRATKNSLIGFYSLNLSNFEKSGEIQCVDESEKRFKR